MDSGRLVIDELFDHISNGDEETKEYLYDWIAHALQFPTQKSQHLLLVGRTGTGKSAFAGEFLPAVFKMKKDNYRTLITTSLKRDCFGKFNNLLDDASLVFCEEMSEKSYKICRKHIDNSFFLRFVTEHYSEPPNLNEGDGCLDKVVKINNRMNEDLALKIFNYLNEVDYAKFYREMMDRNTLEVRV